MIVDRTILGLVHYFEIFFFQYGEEVTGEVLPEHEAAQSGINTKK